MPKYLYSFGYVTPGRPEGTDFEDSRSFFVAVDSKEKALEWGKHLSDAYINSVRQETEDTRVVKGAEWVESEEELRKGKIDYSNTPVVRYGEAANLREIFKEHEEREDLGEGFKGFGEKRR